MHQRLPLILIATILIFSNKLYAECSVSEKTALVKLGISVAEIKKQCDPQVTTTTTTIEKTPQKIIINNQINNPPSVQPVNANNTKKTANTKKTTKAARKSSFFFGISPKVTISGDIPGSTDDDGYGGILLGFKIPVKNIDLLNYEIAYHRNSDKQGSVSDNFTGLSFMFIYNKPINNGIIIFGGAGASFNYEEVTNHKNSVRTTASTDGSFQFTYKLGIKIGVFEIAYNDFGKTNLEGKMHNYDDKNQYTASATGMSFSYMYEY